MTYKKHIIDNDILFNLWDSEKNTDLGYDPRVLTCGAHLKVWWKCSRCGASFLQRPQDVLQSKFKACKKCTDYLRRIENIKSRLKKGRSLADTNPELIKEWIECEIKEITPNDVMPQSKLYVTWKCPKCNGIYNAIISNRTDKHSGCPYCANQKVLKGYNDLQSKYPDIAKTWSEKNKIKSDEVTSHSNQVVFWKCEYGHEDYLKSVKLRVAGQGCQKCANALQTSFPEQAIYFYLKQIFPDAINRYKLNNKYEIDIFIPKINAGIEYNGYYYHKSKASYDDIKKAELSKIGINIIVINEIHKGKTAENHADLFIKDNYDSDEFRCLFLSILRKLKIDKKIDVDIIRDGMQIREQYMFFVRENSIAEKNPSIVPEWNFSKNGNIKPDFVPYGSSQKFYWVCSKCGQEFYTTPKQRYLGKGCPYCARKKVKAGVNDLATKYPNLLSEWDYENNVKAPSEVYGGGETQCFWICKLGHSYKCSIENKIRGIGCPYCAGKKVLEGFNDFESQKPELLVDWDFTKNKIKPNRIHYNSFKQVYWKCHKCGYQWKDKLNDRKKCPNCTTLYKIINVYSTRGDFVKSYSSLTNLCSDLKIASHGNASSVCQRRQKTLMNKFILRYDRDDEFKSLNDWDRKNKILSYLGNINYESKEHPQINVYDIESMNFVKQFNSVNDVFKFLNVKSKSNIVTVCHRKQKTINQKYILRYNIDDEFKGLNKEQLAVAVKKYIGNFNYIHKNTK